MSRLGAANRVTEAVLNSDKARGMMSSARIFYLPGFSLSLEQQLVQRFVAEGSSEGKMLIINLSAEFICLKYKNLLTELASKASYIFGNDTELRAFATASGFQSHLQDDFERIRWFLSNPLKDADRLKAVVITRAERSVIIGTKNEVTEVLVPNLDPQLIRDTNGAGDAFVGGFIAALVREGSVAQCVLAAISVAQNVLKTSGCRFNNLSDSS